MPGNWSRNSASRPPDPPAGSLAAMNQPGTRNAFPSAQRGRSVFRFHGEGQLVRPGTQGASSLPAEIIVGGVLAQRPLVTL